MGGKKSVCVSAYVCERECVCDFKEGKRKNNRSPHWIVLVSFFFFNPILIRERCYVGDVGMNCAMIFNVLLTALPKSEVPGEKRNCARCYGKFVAAAAALPGCGGGGYEKTMELCQGRGDTKRERQVMMMVCVCARRSLAYIYKMMI